MIDTTVLKRLEPISRQHCLLPVGWGQSRKAPMLSGWTTHPGFSTNSAFLWEVNGVRAKLAWRGMIQRKAAEVIREELQEVGG